MAPWLTTLLQLILHYLTVAEHFECPQNQPNCVVDCFSNTNTNFTCDSINKSIINATDTTSLTVLCPDSSCNNFQIECPTTSHLNITGSLQNSVINAVTAETIYIQSDLFTNNTINAHNAQTVNIKTKQTSHNNNIYASYANELQINMANTHSSFDTIYANNATKITLNSANNTMFSTTIYGMFTEVFTFTITDNAAISDNTFYLNASEHVSVIINDNNSSFSNNVLYTFSSKDISVVNKGSFFNNSVQAHNVTLFAVSCIDACTNCNGIWNVINATSVAINMDQNMQATTDFNPFINGSNATNLEINIGEYSTVAHASIYANKASVLTLNINGKFISNDIVSDKSKTVNLNVDFGAVFAGNNVSVTKAQTVNLDVFGAVEDNVFYGENIKKRLTVDIDGIFSANILKVVSAMNVLIMNRGTYLNNVIFGDNIRGLFNMTCVDAFSDCSAIKDEYHLKNAHNISLFINSSTAMDTYFMNLIGSDSVFVDIYIGPNSMMHSNINVTNAYKTLVQIDGNIIDSVINGNNIQHNLSIICNGTDYANGGCNNVTVYTSNKYNLLKCVKYGCKTLNIYTRNDADDIEIKSEECPCVDNVINSCIHEWKWFCKLNNDNQYITSGTYDGGKKCEGVCCGDLVNMLHEDSCAWTDDSGDNKGDGNGDGTGEGNGDNVDSDTDTNDNSSSHIGQSTNGKWVVPLIIGSIVFLLIASAVISLFFWYNRKQQTKRDAANDRMEFVSVSKLTNDSTPSTSTPKVTKPHQKL